jgi:purine-binding chemotaxis protein CheW
MTLDGQMVVLGCGEELFAVPVMRVQEILDLCPISRLPHAPAHLLGLIDVRGESVAVGDLRRLLGQTPTADSAATRIVVLWVARDDRRTVIALKTDRVIEVAALDDGSLGPVQGKGVFNWDDRLVLGIGRRNGRFVTVLDLEHLFRDISSGAKARAA